MSFRTRTLSFLLLFCSFFVAQKVFSAALSCSITTVAACTNPSVVVFRMSAGDNATVELPNRSNASYASNAVCCSGGTGLGNLCSGTFATVAKLSSSTNAHIEQNSQSNYATSTCLSVTGGTIEVGYQATNCTGYDTTIGSMSSSTNSHLGAPATYSTKICGRVNGGGLQTLSYSLSTTTIGFGALTPANARFASSDGLGTSTEVVAHTLSVVTNSAEGYVVTVQGATLTSLQNSSNSITAIGGTNTTSVIGTEQFGLRLTASGGVGTVSSPYAAAGFAYSSTATTSSQVASATLGDNATTTYSSRYIANSSPNTEAGSYVANIIYVITANF